MFSIKISRGEFPRPGPGTSAMRMLLRLTAVKALGNTMTTDAIETNTCTDSKTLTPANWPEASLLTPYHQKTAA